MTKIAYKSEIFPPWLILLFFSGLLIYFLHSIAVLIVERRKRNAIFKKLQALVDCDNPICNLAYYKVGKLHKDVFDDDDPDDWDGCITGEKEIIGLIWAGKVTLDKLKTQWAATKRLERG